MREAYLVNRSQSVTSIPLFEKTPVTVNGREVQKTNYKKLVPNEEYSVGMDISSEKKNYYLQFKSIMIDLKFRQVVLAVVDEPVAPNQDEEAHNEDGAPEGEESAAENQGTEEVYDEAGLMKKRQDALIEIAKGLGLEVTTQDSKAKITKMILEKQAGE